jgi:hypothetical protein
MFFDNSIEENGYYLRKPQTIDLQLSVTLRLSRELASYVRPTQL